MNMPDYLCLLEILNLKKPLWDERPCSSIMFEALCIKIISIKISNIFCSDFIALIAIFYTRYAEKDEAIVKKVFDQTSTPSSIRYKFSAFLSIDFKKMCFRK